MHHRLRSTILIFSLSLFLGAASVAFAVGAQGAGKRGKLSSSNRSMVGKSGYRKGRANASNIASHRARLITQADLESELGSDLDSSLDTELAEEPITDAGSAAAGAELPTTTPGKGRSEPVVSSTKSSVPLGEEVEISDIQYDSKTAGGTVVVTTTGAATYRTREIPAQNQVVLEIANAKLPKRLMRPFNTKDFKQAVLSINAYQDTGSSTARVVLQFRQPRTVDVRQNGKVLMVVADSGAKALAEIAAKGGNEKNESDEAIANGSGADAKSPAKTGNAPGPVARGESKSDDFGDTEKEEDDTDGEAESDSMIASDGSDESRGSSADIKFSSSTGSSPSRAVNKGKILPSSSLDQEKYGDVRFYGKPISIEVRDTSVRDVITLISEQSGANIIMSDDIGGNITIKLRQIPWDQALSIIMKTRGLGYVRQGVVLRIAPIRSLQAEAEEARRIIEAQEATLPVKVRVIPVSFASVTTLVSQIRTTIQAASSSGTGGAATTSRGRIEADARSSSLIVTDTEENIKRIEQLVKALDTAPLQVMIEGKIVEAREEAGRDIGINWGYSGQDLSVAGGTLSQTARISPTLGGANTRVDLKFGTLDFFGDLDARLALFERESMAKIISSPRVITMNAQEATIEQTLNLALATTTITGNSQQTTTSFRPVPTSLRVNPQITPGGDVLMSVTFRREFEGSRSAGTPSIESRNITTNVMVKNGQTTVIGGMYQADQQESEEGTPILRKIPVLGWLFKAKSVSSVRNELLVFLTPRILNADRTLPKGNAIK